MRVARALYFHCSIVPRPNDQQATGSTTVTAPTYRTWQTAGLMAGLMLAVLLSLMDQTVVSTALPTIVGDLGGLDLYAWVFSAYLLAQTTFLPIFGRLSDLYGRRRLFLLGLGLFMAGSALCGQARTMEQLIVFRGIQGIGGAALMPVALAILGVRYEPHVRARLQGILGSAAGVAVIAGPIVGSFIVEHLDWRWVFYVNLPLGVLSAAFVWAFLHEAREVRPAPRIDLAGALTLGGWVSAVLLAAIAARDHAWDSPEVLGLLVLGAILFGAFLAIEARAAEPILPLRLFRHRTVAAVGAATFIRAVAQYALIIYLPLLVEGVFAGTSEDARNVLTVFALPGIAAAVGAGFLVGRNGGYRTIIAGGLAISGVGLWVLTGIGAVTGQAALTPAVALAGAGVGAVGVTVTLAIQNSVAVEEMGIASSLAQFLNNLAGAVGVTLLGAYQAGLLADGVRSVLASGPQLPPQIAAAVSDPATLDRLLVNVGAAAELPPALMVALRGALESSLHAVFFVGLALTIAALAVSLFVRGSAATAQPRLRPAAALAATNDSPDAGD